MILVLAYVVLYVVDYMTKVQVVGDRNLKISDDRIALPAEVDEIGVGIVEWEHDSVTCVNLHRHDRFSEGVRCTESVLTLGHATESG